MPTPRGGGKAVAVTMASIAMMAIGTTHAAARELSDGAQLIVNAIVAEGSFDALCQSGRSWAVKKVVGIAGALAAQGKPVNPPVDGPEAGNYLGERCQRGIPPSHRDVAIAKEDAAQSDAGPYGNHAVTEAIIAGDVAAVKRLIESGLDVNRAYAFEHPRWSDGNATKLYPVQVAGMFGRMEILSYLYAGSRLDRSFSGYDYSLCFSISWRNPEASLFLLDHGVPADPTGGCGGLYRPIEMAKKYGMSEVVAALKRRGAKE